MDFLLIDQTTIQLKYNEMQYKTFQNFVGHLYSIVKKKYLKVGLLRISVSFNFVGRSNYSKQKTDTFCCANFMLAFVYYIFSAKYS